MQEQKGHLKTRELHLIATVNSMKFCADFKIQSNVPQTVNSNYYHWGLQLKGWDNQEILPSGFLYFTTVCMD